MFISKAEYELLKKQNSELETQVNLYRQKCTQYEQSIAQLNKKIERIEKEARSVEELLQNQSTDEEEIDSLILKIKVFFRTVSLNCSQKSQELFNAFIREKYRDSITNHANKTLDIVSTLSNQLAIPPLLDEYLDCSERVEKNNSVRKSITLLSSLGSTDFDELLDRIKADKSRLSELELQLRRLGVSEQWLISHHVKGSSSVNSSKNRTNSIRFEYTHTESVQQLINRIVKSSTSYEQAIAIYKESIPKENQCLTTNLQYLREALRINELLPPNTNSNKLYYDISK